MNARDKELVKQAELMRKYNYAYSKELQEFVSLIRADEREACAKVADDIDPVWESVSAAIRARGNT